MDKVLCAIIRESGESWHENDSFTKGIIVPLIDHPHSDKENGQPEIHCHVDTRYGEKQRHLREYKVSWNRDRIIIGHFELRYFMLNKTSEFYGLKTPSSFISKSKLKHKCIHKGKCPHRGFPLDNIQAIAGVITCPLHSLKFDEHSKLLIT